MRNLLYWAVALFLIITFALAQEKTHPPRVTKEQATKAALAHVKGGMVKSAELEKEQGKLIWSFDITSDSGIREVWVDAITGNYLKTEMESSSAEQDEALMDKAEKIALKQIPGEIVKQETENKNGVLTGSFTIKGKSGKVYEVEVDLKTGKILSSEEEKDEPDEDDDD